MSDYILECEELTKTYLMGSVHVNALNGINLQMKQGDFLAIMGRSGSGKSTLLKMIGGILRPTTGRLRMDGMDVYALDDNRRCCFRRKNIGFVFQKYQLLSEFNIWENICMPLYIDHETPDTEYILALADQMGMTDKLGTYPDQLSGGQQQRAAILRALAGKPKILLADEPTGNLDYDTGRQVMEGLTQLSHQLNQTVIIVTHDNECASYADQIRVMVDGRL